MNVVYSDQPLAIVGPALFLGGPTPRSSQVPSWRPEALELLNSQKFLGTALVPERHDWQRSFDYLDQVEWEFAALEQASALLFWVPRDIDSLPGFTTNVEFGRYIGSGRMIYGRPEGRPHNRYLDWLYTKLTSQAPYTSLADSIAASVQLAMTAYEQSQGSLSSRE